MSTNTPSPEDKNAAIDDSDLDNIAGGARSRVAKTLNAVGEARLAAEIASKKAHDLQGSTAVE